MRRELTRCAWAKIDDPLMLEHHDREWGVPIHDDRRHFEFLLLEGAPAGLSWAIILRNDRMKIAASVRNARAFVDIQRKH